MADNTVQVRLQGGCCVAPMAPYITGNITTPSTLTGQLIANMMYQWIRDTDDIVGATSQTYQLTSADAGHLIRVRMSFTDADNNFITVTSKPVGPIQAGLASPVVFQAYNGATVTASPVTTPLPTGVISGEVLISTVFAFGLNTVFSVSSGWTIIDQVSNAAISAANAYRVATGSNDAPTWSWAGSGRVQTDVSSFTGNSTTTPIGNHSLNTGSGTTISALPIASAGGGTFDLHMLTHNAQTVPLPAGWSDLYNGIGIDFGHRISALNVPTVGTSSGAAAVTVPTSADWFAFMVELRSQ